MGFFTSKQKTGTLEVTLADFINALAKKPEYQQYRAATALNSEKLLSQVFFDEAFKVQDMQGFWSNGLQPNDGRIAGPMSKLKFKSQQDFDTLIGHTALYMDGDKTKVNTKKLYVQGLRQEALNGQLRVKLNNAVEPEANYYNAPPPRVAAIGAPPIPARTALMDAKIKAKAWLKHGVVGPTAAFDNVIDTYVKGDGQWPFGANETIISNIWKSLVTCPIKYRKFNMSTSYPSSIGGMSILREMIFQMSREGLPAAGNTQWEDWALYMYGGTMAVQAFPDGNKRVSRAIYAVLMANASLPFRAPNATLGSALASM